MKVKTSVTLSPEIVRLIDKLAGKDSNRSRVIEVAVKEFASRRARLAREARDLAILNRESDELNEEVADVLTYQVKL